MNALVMFFALCLVALLVLIFAFTLTYFYNFMPNIGQGKALLQVAYSSTFGFFDRSFLIIFIVMIGASALNAYLDPNKAIGLLDIACLFIFAFVFIAFKTPFLSAFDALSMNVIMPNTYSVVSSNWSAMFVMVALALEGVLNFRKPAVNAGGENNVETE